MFTGLVTGKGKVVNVQSLITIQTPHNWNAKNKVQIGDSIAVQGACMTVVTFTENTFSIAVSPESLSKIKPYVLDDDVNLESSLCIGDKLGGHFVTGHVDGIGYITAFHQQGDFWHLTIQLSDELLQMMVYKGSVTVNGVSLTINKVNKTQKTIELMIIPHTQQETVLLAIDVPLPQIVNIEVDMLAKFALKKDEK